MTAQKKDKEILVFWKEIADYLDCEVRTCQRWEKEFKLPVHRYIESSKSRVFAYPEEIDQWMKNRNQSESKDIRKYLYVGIPLIAVVVIYFVFLRNPSFSQPYDFRILGSELVMLDQSHKELWRFDTGIRDLQNEEFFRNRFQAKRPSEKPTKLVNLPLILIQDIDNDQRKEVMFSPTSLGQLKGSQLFCLSDKGNVKWAFKPEREIVFGEKTYSTGYISGFTVVDLFGDDFLEVVLISESIVMFPTQILVLDHKGSLLREYWNSGRIEDFIFYDLDEDGQKEIVLGGCNNEYDKGFVAVLEPDFNSGGSTQTGYYRSPSLLQGVETRYLLFPKTKSALSAFLRDPVARIRILDDKVISIETKSGLFFEFDFEFNLREIRFADRYEKFHTQAYQQGLIEEKFSPKVMAEIKSQLYSEVLYYNGDDWSSIPVMAKNSKEQKKNP